MKIKLPFSMAVLFILNQNAFAQPTRTSIANGNATNPFTWDCTCIPAVGDHIVINHAVVLNTDFGYPSGSVTINSGASLIGDISTRAFALTGGSFTNNGTMQVGDFYHGGGTFSNTGSLTVNNAFASDLTATTNNSGNFTVTDSLYINTNATFINTNNLYYGTIATIGTLTNTGFVSGNDVLNSGTLNNNGGTGFDITNMYSNGTINNNAKMDVSVDWWNSENVTNSNHIVIGNDYWNGDTIAGTATFTNNGTVSIGGDLTNSETMNGSGKYCITGSTTNSGTVSGTLDVCDLSGTDFDLNVGTIAGTVTHCSVSCTIGIIDNELSGLFELFPNPANDFFTISLLSNENFDLTIFTSLGEKVAHQHLFGGKNTVSISSFESGVYFVQINGVNNTTVLPLIKQ